MNKPYILCVLIVAFSFLPFQEVRAKDISFPRYGRFALTYGVMRNETRNISISIGKPLADGLILEVPACGVSYLTHDPHTKGHKSNYSLYQVVSTAIGTNIVCGITKDKENDLFLIPAGLLNSTLYYSFNPSLKYSQRDSINTKNGLYLSPFIKNETDWFITRKPNWAQISPGAGIRLYIGSIGGCVLSSGYQRTFQSDLKGHWYKKDMMFFRFGIDYDFDSIMSI